MFIPTPLVNKATLVLIASISCLCTLRRVVSGQGRSGRERCRWNQLSILRSKGIECFDCPDCPEGVGLVPQCGSSITADVSVECKRCEEGKGYSDTHDISSCKPCTICDPNEETISPCTPTKNAVCGKCNPGFYRAATGDCHRCSWCCADSKDEDKERQCIEQSGLSANQVCRYDVNTIRCAPSASDATARSIVTVNATSLKGVTVAYGARERAVNSKFWRVFFGFFALAMMGGFVVLLYIYNRKNRAQSTWKLRWVTTHPHQVQSSDSPRTPIVFGRKRSEVQMAQECAAHGAGGANRVQV